MKKLLIFLILVSPVLLMVGCDLKTVVDYDRDADFSQVATYAWAGREHPEVSDLTHRRIVDAVNDQLKLKGLSEVESNPDVYITYHGDEDEKISVNTTTYGYGYGPGWYWNPYWGSAGMGASTTTVRTYTEGTLIVDMYRADVKELIWRGSITGTISDNPQDNEKKIRKGLAKLFKDYPPKGGKS
jgi:hypothetical protein